MEHKILMVFILLLLVTSLTLLSNVNTKETDKENNLYQGPVRPTDDEKYFRETGITKSLGVEE